MKFDELYNVMINEAPMSSFLSRLGRGAANIGLGAAKIGAGAVKAAASVPGAVKSLRDFTIGSSGQRRHGDDPMGTIAKKAGELQKGISKIQANLKDKNRQNIRPKLQTPAGPKIEEFDKDVVKALVASQGAIDKTSSTTTQAPGQVTQGQVIASGMAGAQPPETATTATTAGNVKTTQANLLKRDPRPGDVFNLTGKYGKLTRYKILKVVDGKVSAAPVSGSSAGI